MFFFFYTTLQAKYQGFFANRRIITENNNQITENFKNLFTYHK